MVLGNRVLYRETHTRIRRVPLVFGSRTECRETLGRRVLRLVELLAPPVLTQGRYGFLDHIQTDGPAAHCRPERQGIEAECIDSLRNAFSASRDELTGLRREQQAGSL